MKISGFTFIKNATKLYLPFKASVQSVLPLVDEFVIALGDCDQDDHTADEISSIGSDKIKIINTVWDYQKFPRGMEFAHQTDIAKAQCTGDWLFYLQGDELIHEKDYEIIYKRCQQLADNQKIEGLIFSYLHFYGDYDHYQISHGWYKNEVRLIRNDPDIHSWRDAQSFRRIPNFDGISYRQENNTYKLQVAKVNADIYHYGWVRPPSFQQRKAEERKANYQVKQKIAQPPAYGPLGFLKKFDSTHPKYMEPWLKKFNWANKLDYSRTIKPYDRHIKHCKLKYRLLTFIEQKLFKGKPIGDWQNYRLVNI